MRQLLALLVTGVWPAAQTWSAVMTARFTETDLAVSAASMPASSPALGSVPVQAYLDDRHGADPRASGVPVHLAAAHRSSTWEGPVGHQVHEVDLWIRVTGPDGNADMTSALLRRYASAIERAIWLNPDLGATTDEWLVDARVLGSEYAPAQDASTTWALAVLHLRILTQVGVT